jgi:hypothetical protein
MRKIEGSLPSIATHNNTTNGVFYKVEGASVPYGVGNIACGSMIYIKMDTSLVYPTSTENCPASISSLICISY